MAIARRCEAAFNGGVRVERMELFHLRLPRPGPPFDTLLLRAESGGVSGWGEAPVGGAPTAHPEFAASAALLIRDVLAPRLAGREFSGPGPVADLFGHVQGHPMAKAAVESAVVDLFCRLLKKTLVETIGGSRAELPASVRVAADDPSMTARVEDALAAGAPLVVVTLRPRHGARPAVLLRERFPRAPLAVDGDGAFRPEDAPVLRELDRLGLVRLEQPFPADDLIDHARLQEELRTPVFLDESLRSFDDVRRALEAGACRAAGLHPSRLGGLYAAKMAHNLCRAREVPVAGGGIFETGVGRAHARALATLPGFTAPGDWSAPADDVVEPVAAGIGYNVAEPAIARYCVRRELLLS